MSKKNYEHVAHTKFIMRYHLIFSTKYRKKVLRNIIPSVKRVMLDTAAKYKDWSIEVIEIDKSKPDHVHILLRGTPNTRICDVVHKLKQQSTFELWRDHYDYLSSFYYGGEHYLWTRGYFCSTIGEVSEDTLRSYIENQG